MTKDEFVRWAVGQGFLRDKEGKFLTFTVPINEIGMVSVRFKLLRDAVYKEGLSSVGWAHLWGAPYRKLSVDRKGRLKFCRRLM